MISTTPDLTTKPEDPALVAAKIALLDAQTQGQLHDNRMAESIAATAAIATEREKHKYQWELASPSRRRIFYLTGEITDKLVAGSLDTLSRWDKIDNQNGETDKEYTIVLCSPGGDVISGFQLYSYIRGLSERRPVRIAASGMCASMATVIHQAASDGLRTIEPGTTYLLHKVSGGMAGRSDTISDTAAWMEQLNDRMIRIFAERGMLDVDEINDRVDRRECFINPEDVVDVWGLADSLEYTQ